MLAVVVVAAIHPEQLESVVLAVGQTVELLLLALMR
jgi:hypothetical protein